MLMCPIWQVRILTDNRSQDLITKWQYRRGDAWDYRDNGAPYWLCCVICHMRRWLNDERYATGASRPAPSRLGQVLSGQHRLFAGDYWLTAPPPERASLLAVSILSFKFKCRRRGGGFGLQRRQRAQRVAAASRTRGGAPLRPRIVAACACNCYAPPRSQSAEWKHAATDVGPHEMPAAKLIKTYTN